MWSLSSSQPATLAATIHTEMTLLGPTGQTPTWWSRSKTHSELCLMTHQGPNKTRSRYPLTQSIAIKSMLENGTGLEPIPHSAKGSIRLCTRFRTMRIWQLKRWRRNASSFWTASRWGKFCLKTNFRSSPSKRNLSLGSTTTWRES